MLPGFDLQYLQTFALFEMQQRLQQAFLPFQMQQALLLANLMQQKEAAEHLLTENNFEKISSFESYLQSQRPSQDSLLKTEETITNPESLNQPCKPEFLSPQRPLAKKDVKSMVLYLLDNIGTAKEKDIAEVKAYYSKDQLLGTLFDLLTERYQKTIKTKEEMVKYTLRKTLRWMRLKVAKGKESDPKEGMKTLIQQYFGNILKEKFGTKTIEDDKILDKFLPFKKDSRIKTMNTSFITELFQSKEFVIDYQEFLTTFHNTIVSENNRKVEKFIHFLENCYMNQSFSKLKNLKRIPWLTSWINNTMKQARELLNLAGCNRESSRLKPESTNTDEHEPKVLKKVKIEFEEVSEADGSYPSPQVSSMS